MADIFASASDYFGRRCRFAIFFAITPHLTPPPAAHHAFSPCFAWRCFISLPVSMS